MYLVIRIYRIKMFHRLPIYVYDQSHTKYYACSSNGELITAMKLKIKYEIRTTTILFFYVLQKRLRKVAHFSKIFYHTKLQEGILSHFHLRCSHSRYDDNFDGGKLKCTKVGWVAVETESINSWGGAGKETTTSRPQFKPSATEDPENLKNVSRSCCSVAAVTVSDLRLRCIHK